MKIIVSSSLLFLCMAPLLVGASSVKDLAASDWSNLQSKQDAIRLTPDNLSSVRQLLWSKYREYEAGKPDRRMENSASQIFFSGKVMHYTKAKIGERPKNGYPLYIALHGGGGGPARMNDGQYDHMKIYYRDSVKAGVYIVPRGITNTWNLHVVAASYPLYERLIENSFLFDDVDPNRVYIMGFSAGGDGVYQLGPRMSDRWAAASMSAGHHNGIAPDNLMNVPFLFQVGEKDAAYKRNLVAVDFLEKLKTLKTVYPAGYRHQLNIHFGRGHNFLDNHAKRLPQAVITDPHAWRNSGDRGNHKIDTNAIAWLDKHNRNPLPTTVLWDLETTAARGASELWGNDLHGHRHYWLSSGNKKPASIGKKIVASFDKARNTFRITTDARAFELMLSSRMVDFTKPITVILNGKTSNHHPRPSFATMMQTLAERGDPNYLFEARLPISQ